MRYCYSSHYPVYMYVRTYWRCFFSSFYKNRHTHTSICHMPPPPLRRGGSTVFSSLFPFFLSICCTPYMFCFLFFSFLLLSLSFVECVCRACRVQYSEMSLHCLLFLQTAVLHTWYCSTWYLCWGVVLWPQSLYLSRIEASARALVVLDVHG